MKNVLVLLFLFCLTSGLLSAIAGALVFLLMAITFYLTWLLRPAPVLFNFFPDDYQNADL